MALEAPKYKNRALIPFCSALSAGKSTQPIFHSEENIYFNIRFFSFKFCAVKDSLLVKYLEFDSLLNPASAPAPAPAPAPKGALFPALIFHPADQQVCWP